MFWTHLAKQLVLEMSGLYSLAWSFSLLFSYLHISISNNKLDICEYLYSNALSRLNQAILPRRFNHSVAVMNKCCRVNIVE